LPNNFNDQIFWNRVSLVQVGQGLLYGAAQSLAERIKIDECYLKSNTLPSGMEWLTDENGEYLVDENGEYIYS